MDGFINLSSQNTFTISLAFAIAGDVAMMILPVSQWLLQRFNFILLLSMIDHSPV